MLSWASSSAWPGSPVNSRPSQYSWLNWLAKNSRNSRSSTDTGAPAPGTSPNNTPSPAEGFTDPTPGTGRPSRGRPSQTLDSHRGFSAARSQAPLSRRRSPAPPDSRGSAGGGKIDTGQSGTTGFIAPSAGREALHEGALH